MLTNQIKTSAELKQKWENLTLNAYCKLYNSDLKQEMDFKQMNELLIHNYLNIECWDLMNKWMEYGLNDITILENVLNKSNCIVDFVNLAELLQVSLR